MHITIHHGPAQGPVRLTRFPAVSAILFAFVFTLSACAPMPHTDREDSAITQSPNAAAVADPALAVSGLSAAMTDLLQRADRAIEQEDWSAATGMLERALRIDPRQAQAWTRMARVKLGENNPEQGIHMARKSNRYAQDNRALMAYNWSLIARAEEQLGMSAAARKALQKSRQLQGATE